MDFFFLIKFELWHIFQHSQYWNYRNLQIVNNVGITKVILLTLSYFGFPIFRFLIIPDEGYSRVSDCCLTPAQLFVSYIIANASCYLNMISTVLLNNRSYSGPSDDIIGKQFNNDSREISEGMISILASTLDNYLLTWQKYRTCNMNMTVIWIWAAYMKWAW